MNISCIDIGTHCWAMKGNRAVECVVVAIRIGMFFGNNGIGERQFFSDEYVMKNGITYTLKQENNGRFMKVPSSKVFMSKQELIDSL